MAKELPYFRFTSAEWLNVDISLESYEIKGLFIDVCAYYWAQDCDITLSKLEKKFSNATNLLKQLIESDIIKHENKHDKIKIDFLLTQYDLLSEKRKLRQAAGSKGGNAKAMLKQKRSYKDNNKDKDKDKDKAKSILFKESIYFDRVKFKEAMPNDWTKDKLLYYYEAAIAWSGENKTKIDWVATIKNWARKDEKEGKIKFTTSTYKPDLSGQL